MREALGVGQPDATSRSRNGCMAVLHVFEPAYFIDQVFGTTLS